MIKIERLTDMQGKEVLDAKIVQQKLMLYSNIDLKVGDILRISTK